VNRFGESANMIVSIQYLRALAAVMVVLFHTASHVDKVHALPGAYAKFAAGVDIFFVISGFIMWQTTANTAATPSGFMRKRLARIVPLYWLATIAMFGMLFVSGTIAEGTTADARHLLASLFFLPHETPGDPGTYYPVYRSGWTLNYEMFFYIVFSACLLVKAKTARIAALLLTFAALAAAGRVLAPAGLAGFYTDTILLEFAAGVLIAAYCAGERPVPPPLLAGAALAAGVAGLAFVSASHPAPGARVLEWGIPAALILFGAVNLDRNRLAGHVAAFKFLGDASYSLYLTHVFSIGAVAVLWHKLHLSQSVAGMAVFAAVSVLVSLAVAVPVHLLVETPLLSLARGSWRRAVSRRGA
jgi:exopolysaccharide production protein ExoZ